MRLVSTAYPDGTSDSQTYDADNRRITSTDREGRVTSFTYDADGRLTTTTYPDSSTISTTYDAIGEAITSTDGDGNTTSYSYDAAGRRSSVKDAAGSVINFTYDPSGNLVSVIDANGNATKYRYDGDNRQTATVYPDSTTVLTAYDPLGRTISKTDQAGKTTQYGYDADGRLTSVTDALGNVTSYGYDEIGDRISQTDALGRVTTFQYDTLLRRTKRSLPLGMSESYTYDQAGNLLTRTDFNGKTTRYSYDQMNRLLSKTPDASFASLGATFAAPITFTYTPTGRRASMTDPSGTTSYKYDSQDRLLAKATPEGTLTYTYDSAGNVLSVQSSNANGVNTTYSYDGDNRLSSVTDNAPATGTRPGTGTTTYSYDPVGNLSGFLYPNGVQTSYSYDTLNRLTSMAVTAATTKLASYTYTLGPAGNRLTVSEVGGRNVNYGYDGIYRLTSETISADPTTANNGSISYSYDAVGNRLNRASTIAAVPSQTFTYDSNDRLNVDSYDNDGSTTKSGTNTYSYDFENHIVAVNAGTGNAVSLLYDGDGARVSKTVAGTTTQYLVDDNNPSEYAQVVEELTSGSVSRVYSYGLTLLSETQVVNGSWAPSFYGFDGQGSVRLLVSPARTVTDSYDYDAFGVLIRQTGSTPNTYLYSGEQFDRDVGGYYLRARYVNTGTGRFWTTDPFEGDLSDPATLHRYTYAANDPANLQDRSGREFDIIGALNALTWQAILFVQSYPTLLLAATVIITAVNTIAFLTNEEFRGLVLSTPGGANLVVDDFAFLLEEGSGIGSFVTDLLNAPEGSDGFADLAAFRKSVGLQPVSATDKSTGTAAKLEIGGKTFYGTNAHGQDVTFTVNPTSKSHAETHVFQQARDAGVTSETATLTVDRDLCFACSTNGAVKSIARQHGVKTLTVVQPGGTTVIDTSAKPGIPYYGPPVR